MQEAECVAHNICDKAEVRGIDAGLSLTPRGVRDSLYIPIRADQARRLRGPEKAAKAYGRTPQRVKACYWAVHDSVLWYEGLAPHLYLQL